jgi:hypothetical protein
MRLANTYICSPFLVYSLPCCCCFFLFLAACACSCCSRHGQISSCTIRLRAEEQPIPGSHRRNNEAIHARTETRDPTRVSTTLHYSFLSCTRCSPCCAWWRAHCPALAPAMGSQHSIATAQASARAPTRSYSNRGAASHRCPHLSSESHGKARALHQGGAAAASEDRQIRVRSNGATHRQGGSRSEEDERQEENSRGE